MRTLIRQSARLLAWFASATLVVIMGITFIDVIGRTFFGRSLVGTVESVELLMGVLVFSGLAYTEVQRKHIVVETFQLMFPKPVKRLARVINLVLAVGIAGLLTRQLIVKTGEILAEQEHTQILELPYWPTALLMSAGMTLFVVVLLLRLLEEFTDPAKQ